MKTSTVKLLNPEMEFDTEERDMVFRSTMEVRIPEASAAEYKLPGLALCQEIQDKDLVRAYVEMACAFDEQVHTTKRSEEILMNVALDMMLSELIDEDVSAIEEHDASDAIACIIDRALRDLEDA